MIPPPVALEQKVIFVQKNSVLQFPAVIEFRVNEARFGAAHIGSDDLDSGLLGGGREVIPPVKPVLGAEGGGQHRAVVDVTLVDVVEEIVEARGLRGVGKNQRRNQRSQE
jgi:hypothetical protein